MKALLLLILIFGTTQSYAQQIQTQREYTVTRTVNYGYRHNQDNLINSFKEQAPLEYEQVWKYISYNLGIEEGMEFEDLSGLQEYEARLMIFRFAFDYFFSNGN